MKSFVFFWFNEQIVGPINRKKLKKKLRNYDQNNVL